MKRALITVLVILGIVMSSGPSSFAENAVTELGYSMQGNVIYFKNAAVVGKIIEYKPSAGIYIMYGRLSTSEGDGKGWTVFQIGRFYEVIPSSTHAIDGLPGYLGQGAKVFGSMETGPEGRDVLYATEISPYNPDADWAVGMPPAYTPDVDPDQNWLGFGIQADVYNAKLCSFTRSTDLVNALVKLKFILTAAGRYFETDTENYGRGFIVDPKNGRQYSPQQLASVWRSDPYRDPTPDFIPQSDDRQELHRRYLANLKECYPLYPVPYLVQTDRAIQQVTEAVGGFVIVRAMKGGNNSYLQGICAIRPNLDCFMNRVEEALPIDGFSEWASPALFYGRIRPHYKTVRTVDGKETRVYDYAEYEGPYFSREDPLKFVDTVISYSSDIPEISAPDSLPDCYRNCEKWNIYDLSEAEAISLQKQHYTWFVGTRVLEYWYCPPGAKELSVVLTTEGTHQGEAYYSLKDRYMTIERIDWQGQRQISAMGKAEFNFILTCLRDMSLKGGF